LPVVAERALCGQQGDERWSLHDSLDADTAFST
jgi:hypothetical protein